MVKKKILFIAPAIFPYLEEDYISSICRYLPQGIQEKENEIRTFMPKYGCINERKNLLHEVIRLSGQNIIIEDTDHPLVIKVASLQTVRMQIYFIDSEDFFHRKNQFFDDEGTFYPDNDSRLLFFAKGVIETVRKLGWNPDIVHCHGWITSLVPLFIRTCYKDNPLFQDSKLVYSIYNDFFGEKFPSSFAKKLKITGIPKESILNFKKTGYETIIKSAVDNSDAIVVGHPDVKKQILTYLEKDVNKPIMYHPNKADYIEEYDQFYDKILKINQFAE
jgi:starch synthase